MTAKVKCKGHVLGRKEGDPEGCKEAQAEMPQKFAKGQVRNRGTWRERRVHRKKEMGKEGETLNEKIRAGAPELVYLNRKTCSDFACTDQRQRTSQSQQGKSHLGPVTVPVCSSKLPSTTNSNQAIL